MDRPMLATSYREGINLSFPLLATPKIDGVRALKIGGRLLSRSWNVIPNVAIRNLMEAILPDGADGELSVDMNFQKTVSAVMSENTGIPDGLKYYFFDWVQDSCLDTPYSARARSIRDYLEVHRSEIKKLDIIVPLIPVPINDTVELEIYERSVLEQGYEGVVLRDPDGRYKCGRSTVKEGLMIKIKRHDDREATIIGTQELMHNLNEKQKDNFGNVKRSSTKEHKVGSGTLGAIVATTDEGIPFRIGTGFTNEQRASFWTEREELVGKLVKYKYASFTPDPLVPRAKPRCPVFIGIRPIEDTDRALPHEPLALR